MKRKPAAPFQYSVYPNRLKQKLRAGMTAWGTVIWDLPYPSTAEILAQTGFDWVWIDMEHSGTSLETITAFLRTSQPLGLTTLVRPPDAEYHLIARALDCGASGIVVPRVSDRKTAERVVLASRYPPVGRRGVGIHSLNCSDGNLPLSQRLKRLNREVMVVIQIETIEALAQLEEIVSVPGIDVVLLGPRDLTVLLGVPDQYEHPRTISTLKQLVGLSKKYDFTVGCHYDVPKLALRVAGLGVKMVSVSCDTLLLKEGATSVLKQMSRK